jgi:gliotoxin/aspirochlorine biosynthesis aminotransferase
VRTENGKRLLKAYQTIRNILHDRKIPFIQANAGMFVFARLCQGSDNFAKDKFNQLLRKHGVSLATGTSYHFKDEVGWYRICYSVPPEVLMEAFTRIDRCIREFEEIQDDGL